jgi:hypothetical protein
MRDVNELRISCGGMIKTFGMEALFKARLFSGLIFDEKHYINNCKKV